MKKERIEELLRGTVYENETWRVEITNDRPLPNVLVNAHLNAARVQLLAKALRASPIVSQFNSAEASLQALETWRDTHKLPALAELDKEPA